LKSTRTRGFYHSIPFLVANVPPSSCRLGHGIYGPLLPHHRLQSRGAVAHRFSRNWFARRQCQNPAACNTEFCFTCGLYHEGEEIPEYNVPLHVYSPSLWTAMPVRSSTNLAGANAASAASALPTSTAFTTRSLERARTLWTKRAHGCGLRTGSSFLSRSRLARRLVASSAFKFVPVHLGEKRRAGLAQSPGSWQGHL
jgi:hypothetical protein